MIKAWTTMESIMMETGEDNGEIFRKGSHRSPSQTNGVEERRGFG